MMANSSFWGWIWNILTMISLLAVKISQPMLKGAVVTIEGQKNISSVTRVFPLIGIGIHSIKMSVITGR